MSEFLFHHVHLTSPDPLKTAEFYEAVFGARRVSVTQTDSGAMVSLEVGGGGVYIMPPRKQRLVPAAGETIYGIEHFGFKTDNLVRSANRLKAKGFKFVKDVIEPRPGFKTSFLLAPENVPIELFEEK